MFLEKYNISNIWIDNLQKKKKKSINKYYIGY